VAPVGGSGTAAAAGRVAGPCGGPVIVEAIDSSGRVTGRTRAHDGRWRLGGLAEAPVLLRWGCDHNGDGRVPAEETAESGPPRLKLTGAVLVLPTG
jgi:hypothetical protein